MLDRLSSTALESSSMKNISGESQTFSSLRQKMLDMADKVLLSIREECGI